VVGVNAFKRDESDAIPTLRVDESVGRNKAFELSKLKAERDQAAVQAALARVRRCAEGSENLVPPVVEAARAYASLQEICDVLRSVFGTYTDPAVF
jgi:methylmalonyl-CoA mutase N-terminal domain/subunit